MPLEAFQSLCQGLQMIPCCNHLVNHIRANPDLHLCAINQQGYQFIQNGCHPVISNRNSFDEPNIVRLAASQIYFPSDQLTQNFKQTTASPHQVQTGSHVFMFGDDSKNNIKVKTSTSANTQNPRPSHPTAVQSQYSGATTPSNSNDYDYDDERVPIEIGSRGYQAMHFALNLFKVV